MRVFLFVIAVLHVEKQNRFITETWIINQRLRHNQQIHFSLDNINIILDIKRYFRILAPKNLKVEFKKNHTFSGFKDNVNIEDSV